MFQSDTRFDAYLHELLKWNKKINLVSRRSGNINKHIFDSLSFSRAADFSAPNLNVLDIGTGAGFPGIPLKLKFPDIHLTLVESIKKKVEFLKHIVKILELENVQITCERVENLGQKEKFDIAVVRAVAKLPTLAEYALPFLKIGGVLISAKGKEVEDAQSALKILGGKLEKIIELEETKKLVIIKKISKTPAPYPRRPGIPKKKPL